MCRIDYPVSGSRQTCLRMFELYRSSSELTQGETVALTGPVPDRGVRDGLASLMFGNLRGGDSSLRTIHRKERTVGVADETKGRVKEAAGALTDDDRLRREGKADRAAGKMKDAINTVKEKATDAIDAVKGRADRSGKHS